MIDERQKFELGTLWLDGVNTSVSPESVPERQIVWGVNVDNKGGQISTRPGFDHTFQLGDGKNQMLTHFRSSNGTDYVVAGVNGKVYAAIYPFTSFMEIFTGLSTVAEFFTHCEVVRGACRVVEEGAGFEHGDFKTVGMRTKVGTRRQLVISDGVNNPITFDGAIVIQSDPAKYGIPKCTWMAYSKNRLWVYDHINKDIRWSDIDDPTTFYDVGFLAGGGSLSLDGECTGLASLPDLSGDILAFERDRTWVINASIAIKTESEWKTTPKFFRVLFPHVGCLAGKSFTSHYGDLWWWSNVGLTSLRRAQESIQDDELNPSDLEMTRSRKTFGAAVNYPTGVSHENYFLMAMPGGDIWAKNNSPASLLNSNTSPAWVGVWTGLVPKEFCTFTRLENGERFTFALSSDKDGHNRIWRLFRDSKTDNGGRIECSAEFRLHPLGGIFLEKRFLNFAARLRNLWGDIQINGFYRGTRGSWKQILDKEIRVAEVYDADNFPIRQMRKVVSSEADHHSPCAGACNESGRTENIDGAFQLLLKWGGELTLESYQLTAFVDNQSFIGRCEEDENIPMLPDSCGDPTMISYQPPYTEQVNYNFTLTATVPRYKCGYPAGGNTTGGITWPIISIVPTPVPSIPDIPVIIVIPDDTPPRSFTSTQNATAYCVSGVGNPVTRSATATSTMTQSEADRLARDAAKVLAAADLVCSWESTKTTTSYCGGSTIGNPSTAQASYTSSISQEDADEQAMALAVLAANAGLDCSTPPPDTFLMVGRADHSYDQTPYPNRLDDGGTTPATTGVLWTGERSFKDHGSVGYVDIQGAPLPAWGGGTGPNGAVESIGANWICGTFKKYNNVPRHQLAKISNNGTLDTAYPDFFATPANPALSNYLNFHYEGMDGFIAVSGTIRSFNGAATGTVTYLLFNPDTATIIASGQQGSIVGHDNFHNRYFSGPGNSFYRISQAGVTDATFLVDPVNNGPNGRVDGIEVDFPSGLIYVTGSFTKWGGFDTPAGICRVFLSDGKVDSSFQTPTSVVRHPYPQTSGGKNLFSIVRDGSGEVTAIYTPVGHGPSESGRIIKFNPNGSTDTRFKSPFGLQRQHLEIHSGFVIVMSTEGYPKLDKGNFWTATEGLGFDSIFRNYALALNKNTGEIYWPFNSDQTYIPAPNLSFNFRNPGYFNGPITGIR